jgi:beta-lactamase class A
MKMKLILFLLLINFVSVISSQENMIQKDINEIIKDKLLLIDGVAAVYYSNPETGEEIKYNEKEIFHAASTMKLPVMVELFKQVMEGKVDFTDSVIIKNNFRSIADGSIYKLNIDDDSDKDIYNMIGKRLSVRELNNRMITKSSNLATNILIELVGADNVMKTMKDIGANDIQVIRGVEDIPAFRKGLNNTTTANDLYLILKAVLNNRLVSFNLSREIINVLLSQEHNDIIPALLPVNVKVAHKTGWISGVLHDAGIVFLPDGRNYILVLLTKNLTNETEARKILQQISLEFYKYFLRNNY